MEALEVPLIIAGGIVAVLFLVLMIVKGCLFICRPDEVLIFSGRSRTLEDNSTVGFRVVFGGRGWRIPIIERVDRMSLNIMEVPIRTTNAYSKGGIPLHVEAVGNVKVSSDPRVVRNAIERFLGRDPNEIKRVAQETLEGHIRGVLATMTPEEVNEDRLKFTAQLSRESEEDLDKLGIHLDTIKIQHVSDERNYLASIGRKAIAEAIRDAEIAESDAQRDAERSEAQNLGEANVVANEADGAIAQLKNELRRVKADLEAQVRGEEERTQAAARQARATAEQELQGIRAELQGIQLRVDEVLPAEAKQVAREFSARGRASQIREQGRAAAEATNLLTAAWREAGDSALEIYLIEQLEQILTTVATGVQRVAIEDLRLIDGGEGETLAAYIGAFPGMVAEILGALEDIVGIDVRAVVSGRAAPAKPRSPQLPPTPPVGAGPSPKAM